MKTAIIVISIIIGFIVSIRNVPEDSDDIGTIIHIITCTVFIGGCVIAVPLLMLLGILGIIE